jgi:acyl-CoA synthetase (AMP-forming)/AMP-acid ligase II/1-acyl-sn-glycerol-3-phosphate acyltransferase/acyl carrier protein
MLLFPIRWLVWLIGRAVLSLRYRITQVGTAGVRQKPGPYLVLPNHPGYTDPPNILAQFWNLFRFRPVANEVNFQNPILGPFAWLLRTIAVPDMEKSSAEAHQRAQAAVTAVIDALKQSDSVVLWPSGRLSRDGRERLGGTRAVADILAAYPQVTVVLVRTRGLWGSRFGWASGNPGSIVPLMFRGVLTALGSLVFFLPRRSLTMTLEAFTTADRPPATREAINKWLEGWYNADLPTEDPTTNTWPGETPKFVPYHLMFGDRTKTYPPPVRGLEFDLSRIKPATKQAVAEILGDKLKRPLEAAENRAEAKFTELGLDSLDGMDVTLTVEQRFGFTGDAVPESVGQLWALAEGLAEKGPAKPPPPEWFRLPSVSSSVEVLGDTISEAFVNRCLKHLKDTAVADDLAGVVSYERILTGSRLLAARFSQFPEPNLGLMLPASVAGDTTLLAFHLAGKLPVVLNWTTGPSALEHAVRLMGLKRVVTSKVFIDRTHLSVPGVELVFLEEVRKSIGKFEAVTTLLQARWFPGWARKTALKQATTDPDKPAVVLFTSGSEKAPKAVPLSHRNITANIRESLPALGLTRNDSLLGFLPLFHSFGHTVTALFPLLSGIKLLHHPDPTDAGALVRKIAGYKPTITAGTPTFIGFILERAEPGELDSLKIVVLGAEKCPDAIYRRVAVLAPNAVIVEGYGITECAPIVGFNPPDKTKLGSVGKPLPGTAVRIVDLETNCPLPQGQMGMLEISGPSVFPGYLGHDGPVPFNNGDGKRWYITGDLGFIDEDGYIMLQGRLKRFLKAGGEMISLPALEEPFANRFPPTDLGPQVAIEGVETADGRLVVLFCTVEMTLKEANAILQQEGFRGVMRLDEVRHVEQIPVLGTGKTDYKVLRAKLVP